MKNIKKMLSVVAALLIFGLCSCAKPPASTITQSEIEQMPDEITFVQTAPPETTDGQENQSEQENNMASPAAVDTPNQVDR